MQSDTICPILTQLPVGRDPALDRCGQGVLLEVEVRERGVGRHGRDEGDAACGRQEQRVRGRGERRH